MDRYQVIRYPLNTEAAHKIMESHNTLTFVVDVRATKSQIRDALKKLYNVKAQRVNTLIRPDGQKKAFVRLTPATVAVDIATQIGIA
jgi:large subunit ribosomal protein L23Ae